MSYPPIRTDLKNSGAEWAVIDAFAVSTRLNYSTVTTGTRPAANRSWSMASRDPIQEGRRYFLYHMATGALTGAFAGVALASALLATNTFDLWSLMAVSASPATAAALFAAGLGVTLAPAGVALATALLDL